MKILQTIFSQDSQSPPQLRNFNKNDQFQLKNYIALVVTGIVSSDVLLADGNTITAWITKEAEFLNLELLFNPELVADRVYTVETKTADIALIKVDHLRSKATSDTKEGYELLSAYNQVLLTYYEKLMDSYLASATLKGAKERAIWAVKRLEKASPEPVKLTRKRFGSHIFTNDLTVSKVIKSIQDDGELTEYMQQVFFNSPKKNEVL